MSSLDLDRITNPLRLAAGTHQPGSGKGCAMNAISYINGDVQITDYPACSAAPLARLVQTVNDHLADPQTLLLSPENAVVALDLGWQTVGTGDAPTFVLHAWIAEVLTNPDWGVIRYANEHGRDAIEMVAFLHRQEANGEAVDSIEHLTARTMARSAAGKALTFSHFSAHQAAASAIYEAAHQGVITFASYAADAAAYSEGYSSDRRTEFARNAIAAWRRLQGLDDVAQVDHEATDRALAAINS